MNDKAMVSLVTLLVGLVVKLAADLAWYFCVLIGFIFGLIVVMLVRHCNCWTGAAHKSMLNDLKKNCRRHDSHMFVYTKDL